MVNEDMDENPRDSYYDLCLMYNLVHRLIISSPFFAMAENKVR